MPSRELTPAQHAVVRRHLLLIPIYIWTVFAWSIFVLHLPVGTKEGQKFITRDFLHFYAQGVITREHDAHALYDIDAMAATVDRVVPMPVEVRYPPVYGPQVGLFFAVLAGLPYVPAMLAWLAITIVGYLACTWLVWRASPALHRERWTILVLALGWAGLHFTLSFGQASIIGTVCFTTLWLALRSGRLFLAGLAVGALAYKPQLGVVAAFVFVFAKEWRIVAGAIVAVFAQLAAGWAYWGGGIFTGYLTALTKVPGVIDAMEPDKALMHSWRSLFLQLGVSAGAALALSLALSIVTIAFAVFVWRARGALAPRYVVLLLATLLVDPHIFSYDLMLLAPALLVAWAWAHDAGAALVGDVVPAWVPPTIRGLPLGGAVAALAGFVYVAPLLTIVLSAIPVQWSVLSFVLLTLLSGTVVLRARSIKSLTVQGVLRQADFRGDFRPAGGNTEPLP